MGSTLTPPQDAEVENAFRPSRATEYTDLDDIWHIGGA